MEPGNEIKTIDDIKVLVDCFYDKVRADELIGPLFNEIIQDQWPQHLEKMYAFWQTVLLDEHTYYGSPFLPHAGLPIDNIHFERWLILFKQTIQENFSGAIAEEALWRANKMAEMFQFKLAYYRNSPAHPLR
ncbi:group III truncated hemoglobin [Olivibacter ginsenosidimutans]|uniref:Group III truncated hemoglobin n=1 Tax=Olivibacter ginsenosidimutans TaxID=1176537 RepID=A0ABP9BC96_9SPHI